MNGPFKNFEFIPHQDYEKMRSRIRSAVRVEIPVKTENMENSTYNHCNLCGSPIPFHQAGCPANQHSTNNNYQSSTAAKNPAFCTCDQCEKLRRDKKHFETQSNLNIGDRRTYYRSAGRVRCLVLDGSIGPIQERVSLAMLRTDVDCILIKTAPSSFEDGEIVDVEKVIKWESFDPVQFGKDLEAKLREKINKGEGRNFVGMSPLDYSDPKVAEKILALPEKEMEPNRVPTQFRIMTEKERFQNEIGPRTIDEVFPEGRDNELQPLSDARAAAESDFKNSEERMNNRGCEYDNDGDGNCGFHPGGCPKTDVPAEDKINGAERRGSDGC